MKYKFSVPYVLENIVRRDVMATIANFDEMVSAGKFIVQLACGHYKYTGALNKAKCLRCVEMLRRSIVDGSEDYQGFRHGSNYDTMIWEEDPCRRFNERVDLGGNFINN